MKLIGYVRVSSEGQADNTSLDNQQEKIQAYCTALN
ncbi:MAG: recombinase family protein, partial [Dolichospermum sp.]